MDNDLKDMLTISTTVGCDSRMVQGGGGNTSVKTEGGRLMYVKASGTELGDMREGHGYRLVDVQKCVDIINDQTLDAAPPEEREAEVLKRLVGACVDDLEGRPSVETSLHAMLDRCVVHTHPSVVNGLLCALYGQKAILELFADLDPPCLYITYAGAGFTLAWRMRDELRDYRAAHGRLPEVVFLENHGLFVTAHDAEHALAVTADVFGVIEEAAKWAEAEATALPFEPPDPIWEQTVVAGVKSAMEQFYSGVFSTAVRVRRVNNETTERFLNLPRAEELAGVGCLTPDQVVYCREKPVWFLPPDEEISPALSAELDAVSAGVNTPLCVLVPGIGLFCVAPTDALLETVTATMTAILETLSVASQFGGARGLPDDAIAFLRNWEVERFRRTMATEE